MGRGESETKRTQVQGHTRLCTHSLLTSEPNATDSRCLYDLYDYVRTYMFTRASKLWPRASSSKVHWGCRNTSNSTFSSMRAVVLFRDTYTYRYLCRQVVPYLLIERSSYVHHTSTVPSPQTSPTGDRKNLKPRLDWTALSCRKSGAPPAEQS